MPPIALTQPAQRKLYIVILLIAGSLIVFLALLIEPLRESSRSDLQVGNVAPNDIVAPRALTFTSEVQTERQRFLAENAVAPVYTPLDTSVARRQLEQLRITLDFITSVRSDAFATPKEKMADLAALHDIRLSQATAEGILELSENRWLIVKQEAISVLEQVMRTTIQEDKLDEARRNVSAAVSLSLPEEQAEIVAELVRAFVAPNSFYDSEATLAARQQAKQAVEPVSVTYAAGETIVRRGQLITPAVYEALKAFGFSQTQDIWRQILSSLLLTGITSAFFMVYFHRVPALLSSLRSLTVLTYLFLGFLILAKVVLPGHIVIPFAYPLVAFSLTVATLFGREVAFVSTIPLAVLMAYDMPGALELMLLNIFSSFFGILALRNARRIMYFLWAGAAIAISGAVIVAVFRLTDPQADWIGLITLMGAVTVNGVASTGISLILQFFIAQTLGLTTPLQLVELSRPDHPLMQFLIRNAPGTYQHSLQVANLAEQGAEYIGADTLLTRVGALYHDAGKALNPFYFIENQPVGQTNPHNDLDPIVSAATIIQHVPDGMELAQKYRLPLRIRQFIQEHHGTMITRYQYTKAVEAAGGDTSKVDINSFRYPGPRPQSRETALLMLADGCEARVRAERPKDDLEMRQIIQKVIDERVREGELHDADLKLHELDLIADAFVSTLRGVYHPRLEYPDLEKVKRLASKKRT